MRSYVSQAELSAWPTGLRLDDLVAGGTQAAQTAMLALIIQQASSAIDQWCYQQLFAHQRTDTLMVMPNQYNQLSVKVPEFPLTQVTQAQWRQTSVGSWAVIPSQNITIYGTPEQGHKFVADDQPYGSYVGFGQPPLTVQVTYVAGYPNMQLTAPSLASATSITVDNTVGVNAGDVVKVYDGAQYEEAVVQTVSSSTVIDLQEPLQYAHASGVRVSELPDAISTACTLWAAYLLKERRGGGSIRMSGNAQALDMIDSEDMQLARAFLTPYRRVV